MESWQGPFKILIDNTMETLQMLSEEFARSRQEVQIMKQSQEEMRHTLHELQEQVRLLQPDLPEGVTYGASSASMDLPRASEQLVQENYTVAASVWDSALIIGLPILSPASSVTLTFLWLFNFVIQLLFSVIVLLNFGDAQFDTDDLNRLEFFRTVVAHDVKNTASLLPASLASRMCEGDMSLRVAASQVKTVEDIGLYWKDPIFAGPLMCIAAMFCWWLHVCQELMDLESLARASFHYVGKATCLKTTDSGFRLESLSPARCAAMVVVFMCRGVIAGILLVVGTKWLLNTQEMESLVLNAVALEFILSVDDVIFNVLAPRKTKAIISNMEPLETSKHPCKDSDGSTWATILVLCISTVTVYILLVLPTAAVTKDVSQALCSGNTNFVYGFDALGTVYIHDQMQSTEKLLEQVDKVDPRWQAVKQAMDGVPSKNWQYAIHAPDLDRLRVADGIPSDLAVDTLNPKCEDLLVDTATSVGPLRANFRWYSGDQGIEFCTSVKPYCNSKFANVSQRAKWMCPMTCGCHLPTSGSMSLSMPGCPSYCKRLREENIGEIAKCQDQKVLDTELWTSWLGEASSIVGEDLVRPLREEGCAALQTAVSASTAELPVANSHACAGTGPWSELKPLAPLCPSSCGCDHISDIPLPSHCPRICSSCMKRLDTVERIRSYPEFVPTISNPELQQAECSDAYTELSDKAANYSQTDFTDMTQREAAAEGLCAGLRGITSCLEKLTTECSPRIAKVLLEPSNPECHKAWSEMSFYGDLSPFDQCSDSLLSERGFVERSALFAMGGGYAGDLRSANASCFTATCSGGMCARTFKTQNE